MGCRFITSSLATLGPHCVFQYYLTYEYAALWTLLWRNTISRTTVADPASNKLQVMHQVAV